MTISHDVSHRGWPQGSSHGAACLEDKFEVLREIGDGSFGTVSVARVRSSGAHVARRGTLVAVKTMKKTFESFAPCLELREIIFLRSLPQHQHLVPALDIFLDPLSKKLHIAMEYMDGNLYQLMKSRDHKPFDGSSVKSVLFQILSGLEHIHENSFFHRDIKPENILVSASGKEDIGHTFKRYSQLVTPPSTPPSYTIKLADFGLARETGSKTPYTTYVSTRWYRAPEVLLRAGEYSAPVDIWALGAMAVEVATLKPLFPGGNEVDQVWRICEIMGSPGNWVDKQNNKVGGGEWKDGVKLAQKLGFTFPKMAPHTLDSVLQPPQWSPALSHFVTWCLMWDPKTRPTSVQALNHPYFTDAFDPLRPKSSSSRVFGRKHSENVTPQNNESQTLSSKTSSWFRRSLVARDSAPAVPQVPEQGPTAQPISPIQSPVKQEAPPVPQHQELTQPKNTKRNTWNQGAQASAAPMPILPSIRPVSPLSAAVTAHAHGGPDQMDAQGSKKIGRQLSAASHGNHYSDAHRQEAERALNGQSGLASPTASQKESFFSHLRKRARRFSGRHQASSPKDEEMQNGAGCHPWPNNRNSLTEIMNQDPSTNPNFAELDKALQNVRSSVDAKGNQNPHAAGYGQQNSTKLSQRVASNPMLKRQHSLHQGHGEGQQSSPTPTPQTNMAASRSIRRAAHRPALGANQYDAPDEQDELLDEALSSAQVAAAHFDKQRQPKMQVDAQARYDARAQQRQSASDIAVPYPTPSQSSKRNSVGFGGNVDQNAQAKPIDIFQNKRHSNGGMGYPFPTPPYEENEWAAAAAASIAAAGDHYR